MSRMPNETEGAAQCSFKVVVCTKYSEFRLARGRLVAIPARIAQLVSRRPITPTSLTKTGQQVTCVLAGVSAELNTPPGQLGGQSSEVGPSDGCC